MTDGETDGKGEVPTPATCSGDFLAAIEGVVDALRAEGDIEGVALLTQSDMLPASQPSSRASSAYVQPRSR